MTRFYTYRNLGFSLVELVVVLVVFSILTSVAIPAMQSFLVNVQIKTATEALLNGVQLARAEAVRRNTNVRFTLGTNSSWTVGCETPNENLVDGVAICPNIIQSRDASEGSSAVVVDVLPNAANILTFNGLGLLVVNTPSTPSISQFDVRNISVMNTIPRRILVEGSSIRQCNPAHNALDPKQRVTTC